MSHENPKTHAHNDKRFLDYFRRYRRHVLAGGRIFDMSDYKPPTTTKQEIIDGVEEACRIATLHDPDMHRHLLALNYQLGVLKSLANHLPEDGK